MFDLLAGSTDDPRNRDITIEFDIIDGQPTNARFTPQTSRRAKKLTLPLTVQEIDLTVDQSTAEFSFLHPVLGEDAGAKASYHLKVDVKRVHDLLGGEFEATVERPGKPDIVKRGALRGNCDPLRD